MKTDRTPRDTDRTTGTGSGEGTGTGTGTRSGTDTDLRRRTDETLAFLHEARTATRLGKRRSNAFVLYCVALGTAFWLVPLLIAAAGAGRRGEWHGSTSGHLLAGLPLAVPALLTLVVVHAARGAVWRGPVLVDLPTVSWLLPLPVLRGPLLLPRLHAAALRAAAIGLACGGVLGYLLSIAGSAAWLPLTAAGAWAGTAAALTAVAAGLLVERHDRAVARNAVRFQGITWTLAAGSAALCAYASLRGAGGPAGTLALWSGPWGWAAQPLVAAAGHPAPGWPAGAALSAAFTLAALLFARRATPDVPEEALRARATVASRVSASVYSLDLRQARSAARATRGQRARPLLRLPVPRSRWLIVPWRDATGLLRAPGRLLWAALWGTAALGLGAAAHHARPDGQAALCAAALVAEYLAAAQLTEPARLDSDDARRSANLPCSFRDLALRHAWVPCALLLGWLGAGTAAAWSTGRGTAAFAVLVAAVPAMVAAALVSSYRGPVPTHLLVGAETPMGNTAALQTGLWYARGPLAALALCAPALVTADRAREAGAGHIGWLLLVGAAGLWWARRTAHRLHGAPPGRPPRHAGRRLRAYLITRLK
ncbi:DUF6297 family protein [Streptomyces sp. W1SF4]|uniref:DUF6297 family protein n=1 Tax=Streptomyces sp. W1SF4 TaxID=2305220 RepID=UPI000F6E4247|nr:DUF6297 family protein [Streptomyces sp. W1SF4]AZM89778.1 hypothetical protein D1J60_15995 [Streptomyces sp. W1SF4]